MIDNRRIFWMPIGPSGAGKSTVVKQILDQNPSTNVFSLDKCRHEFYNTTDYAEAYRQSVDDEKFSARAMAVFHKMSKDTNDLVVDNTNLSARRRRGYLEVAHRQDYKTVAVLMPAMLQTLIDRQNTRADKSVPKTAVVQHYNALQFPQFGEFEEIVILDHNLAK